MKSEDIIPKAATHHPRPSEVHWMMGVSLRTPVLWGTLFTSKKSDDNLLPQGMRYFSDTGRQVKIFDSATFKNIDQYVKKTWADDQEKQPILGDV